MYVNVSKLELSRAHTLCAFVCSNLHSARDRPVMLTTSTWLVVRMSIKHMACSASGHGWWAWLQWPTKRCYLWCSWTVPNDLKHIQAKFSPISTDWIVLCLRVAQMPRCQDLAIFMVTTTDRQTDCFTLTHAHGVINANHIKSQGCRQIFTSIYTRNIFVRLFVA